jgi:hypothetical protein
MEQLESILWFSAWNARNENQLLFVHVGANLGRSRGDLATYLVAIGERGDEIGSVSSTKAKVHWDYEFQLGSEERKPLRHMQVGGTIPAALGQYGYKAFWDDEFEKPRIPGFPTCYVLVLNWAFLEFAHCPHIERVLNSSWWRDLVVSAENEVLRPFFREAHQFFTRGNRAFLSAFYG